MSKKIKVGDIFVCIKKVIMDNDKKDIAYKKGYLYDCEEDGCITNIDDEKNHSWTKYNKETKEHFLRLKK